MIVGKHDVRGQRGKLLDVVYTLTASHAFITEMKAANKRESMTHETATRPVENLLPSAKTR